MSYTKTTFIDSSPPAISATEMNKIGTGIESAHMIAQPAWVFRPEDYGALGDGQAVRDVATTSGSGVITSTSGLFTASDVGKYIMVNGAIGGANIPLLTTIASYQSATQVTLTNTASVTTTGLPAVWGTDDTTAIRDCMTAAGNYARAQNFYAEVRFGALIYVLAAAPVQSTSPYFNAQLPLPVPTDNTDQKIEIALTGAGSAGHFQFWASTIPSLMGTCLVSMQTAPSTLDGTYGVQSVIGGPTSTSGFTGSFASVKPIIQGISIMCPTYTNMTAIDLTWVGSCRVDQVSAHIFATALSGGGTLISNLPADSVFKTRLGCGLRTPALGNNADVTIPDFTCEGYTIGMRISPEHVQIGNLKTIYNNIALIVDMVGLLSSGHDLNIQRWTAESYNGGVYVSGGGEAAVDIHLVTEASGYDYDVSDVGGVMHGELRFYSPNARAMVVSSGVVLRIVDEQKIPGPVTAPSVPATTVALQNTFWRDAAVTVTGGTVTEIAVAGTATGLTSGTVIVPSGKTITLTYSAAPSWVWILL